MITRRLDPSPPPAPEPPFANIDPIAAWLDVLIRLLRVPPRERAEIRDELESHLRERVRDLMLAGHAEDHATTRAIAELGEAAQLAERFREARNRPFLRRHAMNLSILTVAGAATIMSAVALSTATGGAGATPPQSGRLVQVRPRIEMSEAGEVGVLSLKFDLASSDPLDGITAPADFPDATLDDALSRLAQVSGLPSIIRWDAFGETGILPELPVNLAVEKQLPFPAIVRLLNEAVDTSGGARIEYRVADGILEIAPRDYFDRRETELISYDLGLLIDKGVETGDVVNLITNLVEMENWVSAGGEIAVAEALADRLFVSAPPRMHERVAWIIQQLEQPSARARPSDSDAQRSTATAEAAQTPAATLPLLADLPIVTSSPAPTR